MIESEIKVVNRLVLLVYGKEYVHEEGEIQLSRVGALNRNSRIENSIMRVDGERKRRWQEDGAIGNKRKASNDHGHWEENKPPTYDAS